MNAGPGPRFRLKVLDAAIILAAAGAFAASAVAVYGGPAPSRAVISSERGEWTYPLGTDRVVSVDGPLGPTLVEIRDGSAFFIDSPCRNKTCLSSGHAEHAGDWIACLPNGVFLRVEGESGDDQLDATVR